MSPVGPARLLAQLAIDPVRAHDQLIVSDVPVLTVGLPPFRVTYLLGADANRFVFANSALFTWREAFAALSVVTGETALIVSDGAEHQRRRRLVSPAFTPARVQSYERVIVENAHRVIDGWTPGDRVDLYAEFRMAILRSTIEVLFGPRLAADASRIAHDLQPGLDLASGNPVSSELNRRVRSRAWRKAVTGRRAVAGRVDAEIASRTPGRGDRTDVLGALLASRDDDGSRLSKTEILDQVISLIAAGYETTSAAFGWVCQAMVSEPSAAVHPPEHVVAETLRLYPPAVVSARMSAAPFTYAGVEVPAGRLVLYSPYVTHRSPAIWRDPQRFDPARWDPAAPGHRRPGPHEYLPFGGGAHRCVGARLATLELAAMLRVLRERATVRGTGRAEPRPVSLSAMRPRGGVPAVVEAVVPRRRPAA